MTSDHNPPPVTPKHSEAGGAAETGGAVELLACWFCGKSDAFVERDDLTSAYVMCNACGARGPSGCQDSDDEEIPGADAAKRLWNTRAADSRITADDERYARELLDDLKRDDISPVAIAIKWFRKARHECVRAASDTRAPVVSSQAGKDWQLVPKEPTKEMIQACIWALDRWREKNGNVQGFVPPGDKYQVRWRAMLAAAPSHSSDGGVEKHGDFSQTRSESPGAQDRIVGVAPDPSEAPTPAPGGMELADELEKVRRLTREHIGPTMDKIVQRAVVALRTASPPAPALVPDYDLAASALGFVRLPNGKWYIQNPGDSCGIKTFDTAEQIFEWWGRASGNASPALDARTVELETALDRIIDIDTRVSDGGKVHDHGPCAEIAIAALAARADRGK
jgi:hypothetical protein